ncbi:MAG: H4MPT-linked C1 transfer pathway protein [Candidatus Bathyarchaeota archaeon]|nr:H4MPT-linked C1 transfer pathway protein [Candidatus Termiticorpusculum sp.]
MLGLDIGGANTKAAYVRNQRGVIEDVQVFVEYFPVWKNSKDLEQVLQKLRDNIGGSLDVVGVTMTAELADVYQTKREGVEHILGCVKKVFLDVPIYVLNTEASLESLEAALAEPVGVAAANWAATGWLVAQYFENCIVVDVGSTSTSIIPIINGKIAAQGKADLDKLICGELVYTGSLRTNLAAIVQTVPVKNAWATVSSELFALSGDVHLILGHITREQYISETADGKGTTYKEALTRLARLICADTEMLTEKELTQIAQHIYEKQIQQITKGLNQVYKHAKKTATTKIPILTAGLGKDFLAHKAAKQTITTIIKEKEKEEKITESMIMDLGKMLPSKVSLAVPAVGVALMTAKQAETKTKDA